MTAEQDDLPVRDRPVPRRRTALDELHRWRYYALLVALVVTVIVAVYWYFGSPGFDLFLVASAVALAAAGVAAIVGLPFAFIFAKPPEQRALVYLGTRGELDFGVEYFTVDEWDDLEVRWGELKTLEQTTVPAAMALGYDQERHAAWGTHRAVMDPDEFEQMLYHSEEIYGRQEEELANLRKLKFVGRTLVRRSLNRQLDENNALYDELTLPAGDTLGDVWKDMREEMPQERAGETPDPTDVDVDQDDGDVDLDDSDLDELRDYLADTETSEQESKPTPDGGRTDDR